MAGTGIMRQAMDSRAAVWPADLASIASARFGRVGLRPPHMLLMTLSCLRELFHEKMRLNLPRYARSVQEFGQIGHFQIDVRG